MERINVEEFVDYLRFRGLNLWAGVPDSLLKDLCACASNSLEEKFVITANEGNAVGVACGWHVATGEPAVVYMQNSGEGNAINPLVSLADRNVYSIPMLLVIGWRGEPGVQDEPQHVKQGQVTLSLLESLGIHYEVLEETLWRHQLNGLLSMMIESSSPVALVIRKNTFTPYSFEAKSIDAFFTREEALRAILRKTRSDEFTVSTTGKESRELYSVREERIENHDKDFLCIGGMGHTLSVAWGLARGHPNSLVWCLDGDGSMIMHMGSLAVFAQAWPKNLRYIVNINGVHESVGGQPNVANHIDVAGILRSCGFENVVEAQLLVEVERGMDACRYNDVYAMVIYTQLGSRSDLGRPNIPPCRLKESMMALTVRQTATYKLSE